MLKKCALLGLALLLVGGLSLAWLRKQADAERREVPAAAAKDALQSGDYLQKYGHWYRLSPEEQNQLVLELDKDRQNKTPTELAAEQKRRLRTDLPRLAAGEMNPGDIAEYLYGPNWEDEVIQYRLDCEQEQIAQTTSIVCLSIGGVLFGVCSLIWVFWAIARVVKAIAERRAAPEDSVDWSPTDLTDIPHEVVDDDADEEESSALFQSSDISTDRPQPAQVFGGYESDPTDDHYGGERFLVPRQHRDLPSGRPMLAVEAKPQDEAIAMLMSDEPSGQQEWSADMEWSMQSEEEGLPEAAPQHQRFTPRPRVTVLGTTEIVSAHSAAAPLADPLTEQAEDLQRQIAEFKQMAQSVQQATREQSAPLGDTLKELTQQVSAIREYASSQQDRVEKLQDGYDWNIIRTFCLRVIRCIDNLENRIGKLGQDDDGVNQLEEVRDELLFALESSGIEQFRPDTGSDYRGQEKFAEAVKEKQATQETNQIGTIAKVVRPGYRYITDEDSFKVVRTAQVKLFG